MADPSKDKPKERAKDRSKPKQKERTCRVCGSKLEYLTEFKKSFVCPKCGGKELNFAKKKVDEGKHL